MYWFLDPRAGRMNTNQAYRDTASTPITSYIIVGKQFPNHIDTEQHYQLSSVSVLPSVEFLNLQFAEHLILG